MITGSVLEVGERTYTETFGEDVQRGHPKIEELSGQPVTRFSYPYGRFDDGALAAVRELGIDVACSSVPIPAVTSDHRAALPRL
ncbi:polysaccharide deacetylase family protein [Rhodococcus sp. NPDC003318]|uniref:polysaccharide deacetylase family protein n=1 Tax=Rhodococcus sp. NPDC003318 TaxID=3364503 RepID=UPI0036CC857A